MNRITTIAVALGLLTLAACGNEQEKVKSDATRPNSEGLSAAEIAARATTDQASLTPAEREAFRKGMVDLLDETGLERAEGHSRLTGLDDQVVAMQPLQSHTFTVPMTASDDYLVFAACDGDCTVVDLTLLDPAGAVIKTDTDSGDFPVLDYTPDVTGSYAVRMTMAKCALAPCYAGARAYKKDA